MTLGQSLAAHRSELLSLAARHGVTNLRVFGSVARGEDHPQSDLDVLVDVEPGRTMYDVLGFEEEAEALLHHRVDVLTLPAISPFIRERILLEARPL